MGGQTPNPPKKAATCFRTVHLFFSTNYTIAGNDVLGVGSTLGGLSHMLSTPFVFVYTLGRPWTGLAFEGGKFDYHWSICGMALLVGAARLTTRPTKNLMWFGFGGAGDHGPTPFFIHFFVLETNYVF